MTKKKLQADPVQPLSGLPIPASRNREEQVILQVLADATGVKPAICTRGASS